MDRKCQRLQYSAAMAGKGEAGDGIHRGAKNEPSSYGLWVRVTRQAAGMSQTTLARLAGINRIHLCQIETGRTQFPRSDVRYRISAALGRDVPEELAAAAPRHFTAPPTFGPSRQKPSPYGRWLQSARQEAGLSQYELAELAGVCRTLIAFVECGRTYFPRLENRRRLSRALGREPPPRVLNRVECSSNKPPHCSFCGELEEDCKYLFCSKVHRRARICSMCLQQMTADVAVQERRRRLSEPSSNGGSNSTLDRDEPSPRRYD